MAPFWRRTAVISTSDPECSPALASRVSHRVSGLVAKFEALASSRSQDRSSEPPAPRSIESVVTATASISRQDVVQKALGRKASQIFRGLVDGARDNDQTPQEQSEVQHRPRPPPRKLLTASLANRKLKRKTAVPSVEGKDWKLRGAKSMSWIEPTRIEMSDNQRWDPKESLRLQRQLSNSQKGTEPATTMDGSLDESSNSSPDPSSPPVAKVLPSSFFAQLVRSDIDRPVQRSKLPAVLLNSEDEDLILEGNEKLDHRKFRLQSFGRKQPVWKRKVTPPRVSVKDLISRFRQPDAERSLTREDASKSAIIMNNEETLLNNPGVLLVDPTPNSVATTVVDTTTDGNAEIEQAPAEKLGSKKPARTAIATTVKAEEPPTLVAHHPAPAAYVSVQSSLASTMVSAASSLRSIFASRGNGSVIPIKVAVTPEGYQHRGTSVSGERAKFRSLSSLKVNPKRPMLNTGVKTVVARGSFYSPRLATAVKLPPPTYAPKQRPFFITSKTLYRKTPPPMTFFTNPKPKKTQREYFRINICLLRSMRGLSNCSGFAVLSDSNTQPFKHLATAISTKPNRPTRVARPAESIVVSKSIPSPVESSLSEDSLTIWVGTPAITIVTPIPVNMVTTFAIRDFVHRFL